LLKNKIKKLEGHNWFLYCTEILVYAAYHLLLSISSLRIVSLYIIHSCALGWGYYYLFPRVFVKNK